MESFLSWIAIRNWFVWKNVSYWSPMGRAGEKFHANSTLCDVEKRQRFWLLSLLFFLLFDMAFFTIYALRTKFETSLGAFVLFLSIPILLLLFFWNPLLLLSHFEEGCKSIHTAALASSLHQNSKQKVEKIWIIVIYTLAEEELFALCHSLWNLYEMLLNFFKFTQLSKFTQSLPLLSHSRFSHFEWHENLWFFFKMQF